MSMDDATTVALPGAKLSKASRDDTPGSGVHTVGSDLYASVTGFPITTSQKTGTKSTTVHSITRPQNATQTLLPTVGAIVLARVIRLTSKQAIVNILSVADNNSSALQAQDQPTKAGLGYNLYPAPSGAEFQGLIRVQDIRATEKDKVKVVESFRPGDIVRAVVISLGDQRDYYLSTAGYTPEDFAGSTGAAAGSSKVDGNVLGVILATSDSGNPMVPVSWKEMGDVVTGAKESRKVAKPD